MNRWKSSLTCSYCSKIFKNPVELPCKHSVCKEHLLEKDVQKLGIIKCVECKQEFQVKMNIIYQDNISTIKLQNNGKLSNGKRIRHYDIKLFYITGLIWRNVVQVQYCPTDDMIVDYMSKPLVGAKFLKNRDLILNLSNRHHV